VISAIWFFVGLHLRNSSLSMWQTTTYALRSSR